MSKLEKPTDQFGEINEVGDLLSAITRWKNAHHVPQRGFHNSAWFRGHSKQVYDLEPGVYRPNFTSEAQNWVGDNIENKRLNLEREILSEFRVVGATLLDPDQIVSVYFIAQHHGLPTRLLDWTTNPLASLFFCVNEQCSEDGDIFIMNPAKVMPDKQGSQDPLPHVRTMRHPYARAAIGESFWHDLPSNLNHDFKRLILSIRPDNKSGRIGQQSSCFTLHMHGSKDYANHTLARLKVPACSKEAIRDELCSLNINEFSIYNDLDHLAKAIKLGWRITS